jgi:hypothetical protein
MQGMFAEVMGCTMFASSIFLTYALIVVVGHMCRCHRFA